MSRGYERASRHSWLLVVLLGPALAGAAFGATPQDEQIALAAGPAVKIAVRGQGWVHVGQVALVAAGLDAGVDPAMLQLYADGVEHAFVVTGNGDAHFTSDEAIEFYGTGRDSTWTDVRTYWLVVGAAGARVPLQTPAAGGAAPTSFPTAQRLVEHTVYLSAIRNGDASNFFGGAVSSTPVAKTITLSHVDASVAAAATLRVSLQGVTANAHVIDVSLNGTALGQASLANSAEATFSFAAPNIVEGDNHITLTGEGTSADFTAIEGFELDYGHTYAADADTLALTAPAATRLTISGFSAADVRVLDVTDETHPVELAVTVATAGGTSAARVDVPAATGGHALYAFTGERALAPAGVAAHAPSSWTASHDGDLVILSHPSFLSAMEPLVAQREHDGWSVQLVDVQDVYDELGFGDKTAVAVRDFLASTRAHWRVPPRFVLLVGDATFDPRNYLGLGDYDFVPTMQIDTSSISTASDDWFVDANLDGVPEMAVGRMPVRTADEASAVVQKTLAYAGTADLPRGGLFVTDADEPELDFTEASAASEAKVSDIMPIDRFTRGGTGDTPDVLLDKLDAGPFLVNYMGHGSVEVWDDLLTSSQASALTNAHASVYVVMNCLNGLFDDLYTTSLAESLLEAPQGGAVAVWASSTLAEFAPQPAYNQEFLMHLSRTSLGESAIAAKQAITDLDSRRTWLLFGDPTLFGTPLPATGDAGTSDGGTADAGTADAGTADAGTAIDAATPMDAAGDATSAGAPDAGVDALGTDAATDTSAALDAAGPDGGAQPDAAADLPTDATTTPAGGGCACRLDATTPATPGGLAFLLASGFFVALRGRRPRRARRRWPAALLTLVVVALAWAPRAHAGYSYRRDITIDRTRIGTATGATTLTNYPLLLDITSTSLIATTGHVTSTSGYDIIFLGSDTTTCGGAAPCVLTFEVESYTASTGHIIAWVQVPALKTAANTSNSVLTVEYGNAAITSPTQTASNTWDSSFKAVWHFDQDPTMTTETDSTTTGAAATSTSTPAPATATGLISSGVTLSGTTGTGYFDYRSTTFNWLSTDTFTYSGWFNTSDSYGPLLSQRDNGAGHPVIDIMLGYDGNSNNSGKLEALVRDDTGGANAEVVSTGTVNDSAWHSFALTRSGSTIQLYLDGASINTASGAGVGSTITTGAAGDFQHFGKEGNWVATNYGSANTDQRYLGGTLDEYRISNTIRSADWIKTDYNTQLSPSLTYSIGSEIGGACGDGMIGSGETCDDGNILSGDGCSSACAVESGYACVGSPSVCTKTCGDGMIGSGETCDDGNGVSGDGCSSACAVESGYSCSGTPSVCTTTCGDGIPAGSEGCDDGNLTNGDGCSSTCTVESGYACNGTPSNCRVPRFNYLKFMSVDRTKVGTATGATTLTNYPVLISVVDTSLRTVANGGRVSSASGYDIIFRGLNTTVCGGPAQCTFPHEIESYDGTTGTLVAWVQIPTLNTQTNTSNTSFEILFGNSSITTATQRVTSTWDSSFKGVWHLSQTPSGSGSLTDSTSNANNGTPTSVTSTSAEIGNGISTDGSTSFVSLGAGTSLNVASGASFTYSTWVKTTDALGSILSLRRTSNGNPVVDINIGYDGSTTSSNALLALVRDDTGGLGDINGGIINNNAWHFITVTRSGSTITLYVDAVSKGTAPDSGVALTSDLRNVGREGYWATAGGFTTDQEYLAATIDEVRSSSTNRSIEWITTDYNNQLSPSSFIIYTTGSGAEVSTNASTDVSLLSFDAAETCLGTTVTWKTAYEVDTLGFNMYREVDGHLVQLNASLIPGAGISGGGSHMYTIVDPGSHDAGRTYSLETVHFSLDSTWAGPVTATPGPSCSTAAGAAVTGTRPTATPLAAANVSAPTTTDATAEASGGCALAPRRALDLSPALLALGLLVLARRRRRR